MDLEERLLTVEDLARVLRMASKTIRNNLSRGAFPIPAKKICGKLLWDRKDVERYLDRLRPVGGGRE